MKFPLTNQRINIFASAQLRIQIVEAQTGCDWVFTFFPHVLFRLHTAAKFPVL